MPVDDRLAPALLESFGQLEELIVDLDLPVFDAIPHQPGEGAEMVGAQEVIELDGGQAELAIRRLGGVERQLAIGVEADEVAPAAVGRLREPQRPRQPFGGLAQPRRQPVDEPAVGLVEPGRARQRRRVRPGDGMLRGGGCRAAA